MSMSSPILFNCKPGPLLCSSSTSSFIFKFKFPARSQCSPLPTVEFHATTPRASTHNHNHNHNHISIENESGSGAGASTSTRRALVFVAATTTPLLLLFNHEAFAVKAAGLATTTSENYLLIKEEVRKVLSKAKAAGVLRLVFHDAGTFDMDENSGGMNGSIVYELDRPENAGLKKPMKILEKAKTEVDAVKPDMIAVAGAESVSLCGGPTIPVPLGRLDSMEPDPERKLPQESLDAPGLKQSFQRKGLSTQDLVALSGAHTLGSKGFGNPTVFDNSYFKILLQKPWTSSDGMASMIGLPSDRALTDDNECLRWITKYAENQSMFFEDFKNAYTKLVNSGAKWKSV